MSVFASNWSGWVCCGGVGQHTPSYGEIRTHTYIHALMDTHTRKTPALTVMEWRVCWSQEERSEERRKPPEGGVSVSRGDGYIPIPFFFNCSSILPWNVSRSGPPSCTQSSYFWARIHRSRRLSADAPSYWISVIDRMLQHITGVSYCSESRLRTTNHRLHLRENIFPWGSGRTQCVGPP